MLKLLSYPLFSPQYQNPGQDVVTLNQTLSRHGFSGIEVIQYDDWRIKSPLPPQIKGIHMRFWPIWLDFWRGNEEALLRQFGSKEAVEQYYGGSSREALVAYYRHELKIAESLGVLYVVFHVCHVELEHCYDYQFTYSDLEIIEAFIELLNETLQGLSPSFELLFENVWWPGLTLLDQNLSVKLIQSIQCPHKGFMLDVGHLMNTNLALKTEEEAIQLIMETLDAMGESIQFIKGIHLHSSLTGNYVKGAQEKVWHHDHQQPFWDRYFKSFEHIGKIDEHKPFKHKSIQAVINRIKPKYLVYEFSAETPEILDEYLIIQNRVLAMK